MSISGISKEEQQRIFLSSYIDKIDYALNNGVNVLLYFCNDKVMESIGILNDQKAKLIDIPENKGELKVILQMIEDEINYLTYLFAIDIGRDIKSIDESFSPMIDENEVAYRGKIAKALAAKQKRAPGFDGQGGGRSRGK